MICLLFKKIKKTLDFIGSGTSWSRDNFLGPLHEASLTPPWEDLNFGKSQGGQMMPLSEAKIQHLLFFGGFEKIKKTLVFIGSERLRPLVFFCPWPFSRPLRPLLRSTLF